MDRAKTAAGPLLLLGISAAVLCFHIYLAHGRPYRGLVALGPPTIDHLPQQQQQQQQHAPQKLRKVAEPQKKTQHHNPQPKVVQQKRQQPGKAPPKPAAAATTPAAAGNALMGKGDNPAHRNSSSRSWSPDRYIARYLYPRRKHGVFLQYGCLDVSDPGSSIGILAAKRQWTGACLEPDPSVAAQMSRQRPKELAAVLHGALCGRHPVTGKYRTNFTRFGPPFQHWTGVWDAKHPWQQREISHMVRLGDARVTGSTQKVPCTNPVQAMSKWGVFQGEEVYLAQQQQKQLQLQQQQQLRRTGRKQQQQQQAEVVVTYDEEQVQLRGYIHLLALHIPPDWPILAKQLTAAAKVGLSIDVISCSAACHSDTASVSQTWVKSRASALLAAVGYKLHVPEYYQKIQGHRARPVAGYVWVRKGSAVAARLQREQQHHLADADLDLVGQIY